MTINNTPAPIHILVQLSGAPKAITGQNEIPLELAHGSDYGDAIQRLAETYPDLVGVVITATKRSLLPGNVFVVNDEAHILQGMEQLKLHDGDRVMLIFFMVGG